MIIIGSDHIGFQLKQEIKEFIGDLGYEFEDYGCFSDERVHYPVYAYQVAKEVSKNNSKKGILLQEEHINLA